MPTQPHAHTFFCVDVCAHARVCASIHARECVCVYVYVYVCAGRFTEPSSRRLHALGSGGRMLAFAFRPNGSAQLASSPALGSVGLVALGRPPPPPPPLPLPVLLSPRLLHSQMGAILKIVIALSLLGPHHIAAAVTLGALLSGKVHVYVRSFVRSCVRACILCMPNIDAWMLPSKLNGNLSAAGC